MWLPVDQGFYEQVVLQEKVIDIWEKRQSKTPVDSLEQCHKKGSIEDAILTLQKLVICQQDDEQYMDAIYWCQQYMDPIRILLVHSIHSFIHSFIHLLKVH